MLKENNCYLVDGENGEVHVYTGPRHSMYGHKKLATFKKRSSAVKFMMRRGRHNIDIIMNTPSDRELGTSSLTDIYKRSTPGQSEEWSHQEKENFKKWKQIATHTKIKKSKKKPKKGRS